MYNKKNIYTYIFFSFLFDLFSLSFYVYNSVCDGIIDSSVWGTIYVLYQESQRLRSSISDDLRYLRFRSLREFNFGFAKMWVTKNVSLRDL